MRDSDDSSSSSLSRSRSSSSSSSRSSNRRKYLPWTTEEVNITNRMIAQANLLKFKKRADLLNFHQQHPGGLAAPFLWQVKQLLGGAAPRSAKELSRADCSTWANMYTNLREIRDQREVQYLTKILLELGRNRLELVADLLAMRIREILSAKKDGGSWDKVSVLSLLPGNHGGQALLPEGGFVA